MRNIVGSSRDLGDYFGCGKKKYQKHIAVLLTAKTFVTSDIENQCAFRTVV